MPLEAHIKERPAYFHRFDAVWTPTILILDSDGVERVRVEGYLPKEEFRAQLEAGLARATSMESPHWESFGKAWETYEAREPAEALRLWERYGKPSCARPDPGDQSGPE